MWPFRKKTKQRRLEVRKTIPSVGLSIWRRFREGGGIPSVLLVALFYLCVMVMDVWPIDPLPYRVGQYIPNDVYARVSFQVRSQKLLDEAEEKVRQSTPATFTLNTDLVKDIVKTLKELPPRLKAATRPADLPEPVQKEFGLTGQEGLNAWQAYVQGAREKRYGDLLDALQAKLAQLYVVKSDEAADQQKRTATQVRVVQGEAPTPAYTHISNLIALDRPDRISEEVGRLAAPFDPAIRESVKTYLLSVLGGKEPLYRCDAAATQKDINEAIQRIIANPPEKAYEIGNLLVRASRRQGPQGEEIIELRQDDLELLKAERDAYRSYERRTYPWRIAGQAAGRAIVLLLVTVLLCVYSVRYRPQLVRYHWRGFSVIAVMILMLAVNKIMTLPVVGFNTHCAILTVLSGAILMTIIYSQRYALAAGAGITMFVVLQLRADLGMFLVLVAGVFSCIFLLNEIRTRTKLIEVTALAAAAVFATVWAHALATGVPWKFALLDSLWSVGFALLAGLLLQGVLPLVERIFRVATSMTLLEWCDASKPLMRLLAMEAPGTYNHSLQLGTMCEAAAEAVGARGLLARVGAYYHDIGKINKPEYFVENQAGLPSKHSKLSPAMSLLIITAHVKDGLEMAGQYGLPPVLHEFIATHHGTTLVQYFYHAATEQRKTDADRAPDEVEFRYPGPKPRTKEAAILMLADAAESSVRSMSEPTPGRIENQVHAMITRRLMDAQLDDCELTLQEVHQIETSIIKSLCSIYHSRISYPTPAGQKPSAAELHRNDDKNNRYGSPSAANAEAGMADA